MKPFKSFMAQNLEEYATYRRQLGYARKAIRPTLLTFDRYLQQHNANWDQLRPAFFLQLRASISDHPNTTNRILSQLRSLFDYLVRREICEVNPLRDIPSLSERYFVPFVFSPAQTEQLLGSICENIRHYPRHFLFDMAVYVAVGMLVHCGMRINEPLRLYRSHYRPDEGSVYIEKTKFRKDRLIPLPKVILRRLKNYLASRDTVCPDDENPYLLAGRKTRPLKDYHIRKAFHRAVETIGLKQSKRTMGNITFGSPVTHSLRHSFAIRTLNDIKARGISPHQALPVLAVYMGHCKYQYTAAYLKVKDANDIAGLMEFTKSQLDVI